MRLRKIAIALLLLFSGAAHAEDPWIGLVLAPGSQGGTRVKDVVEGAPGQRAGIQKGDEVLALDGERTGSAPELIAAVKRAGVGKTIKLKLADASGKQRVVAIALEARPQMGDLQRGSLVGHPAPDFEPAVQSGAKLPRLSALKGNVVLIDFFATWCGPCVAMMPHIEHLSQAYASKGLKVIGVSTESASIVAGAAHRFHLSYPLASDESEEVSQRYHVFALPTMVVIDRKGMVREVSVADPDAVDAAIEAALKEK
jgi:peroxiredoxin